MTALRSGLLVRHALPKAAHSGRCLTFPRRKSLPFSGTVRPPLTNPSKRGRAGR
nr:MAG TPA: hypothetical protein [Inoviridae sp.]